MSFTPMSLLLCPLQEARTPGQARTEPGQQHVVAALDPALANRLFQRQGNRGARGVAVLVDVDRDTVERQPDPARGRVEDPEGGLVRNPQTSAPERHARRVADLIGLADEDVDGELEDVRSDHLDIWVGILRRVGALLDVPASHLRVTAAVRTETPAEEAGALGCRPHGGRAGTVTEDDRR